MNVELLNLLGQHAALLIVSLAVVITVSVCFVAVQWRKACQADSALVLEAAILSKEGPITEPERALLAKAIAPRGVLEQYSAVPEQGKVVLLCMVGLWALAFVVFLIVAIKHDGIIIGHVNVLNHHDKRVTASGTQTRATGGIDPAELNLQKHPPTIIMPSRKPIVQPPKPDLLKPISTAAVAAQPSDQPSELDVLEPAAATALLFERTRPSGGDWDWWEQPSNKADVAALAAELGGWSLGLEQAAAYIVACRMTPADYLKRWKDQQPAVQQWYRHRDTEYPCSVVVTLQMTLDHFGPREIELLNLLAWFAPEPVPTNVLTASSLSELRLSAGVNAEAENSVACWTDDEVRDTLTRLTEFRVIRQDPQAGSITLHRVVQKILRDRQAEPQRWLTAALGLLDQARPAGDADDARTWPVWEPLRPHVAFATAEGDRLGIAVPTSCLMGDLATLLGAKGLHKEAKPLQRRALAIDELHYGPESTEVATRLNNLAQTLQVTNRLAEAEPLIRRALSIWNQSSGADHPNVADALNNLAHLLQATNRLAEAEPLVRRALAIDEQFYGVEHPKVARDLNTLAMLLHDTNRRAEAETLMRRALAIDEQFYGAEHPTVAIRLNDLAVVLLDTNRLVEAGPLLRRALSIDEQAFDADHPRIALRLNNLAMLLRATSRLAEAEPLMRRSLAIREQSFGADHPEVGAALNNLALLLKATNRLAEAEPLMRRALAIGEQSFGEKHPKVVTTVNNLAILLQATNQLAEAKTLMNK